MDDSPWSFNRKSRRDKHFGRSEQIEVARPIVSCARRNDLPNLPSFAPIGRNRHRKRTAFEKARAELSRSVPRRSRFSPSPKVPPDIVFFQPIALDEPAFFASIPAHSHPTRRGLERLANGVEVEDRNPQAGQRFVDGWCRKKARRGSFPVPAVIDDGWFPPPSRIVHTRR